MIRHKLLPAVVAAALLTVGACGSTSGTPTAQESPTVSSSASQTGETSESSSSSASAEDSATMTTAETESATSTAVTVDGTMDAQSAAWFDTVCGGVSPMIEAVFGAMGAMMNGASDPDAAAKAQATLVAAFNKASGDLTEAAKKLSALPPPTIDHGDAIAAEAAAGLAKAGPAMKQMADTLSKAKVTSMTDLSTAMDKAQTAIGDDLDGLSLDKFELSDAMQAEVAKLPSCAPLMSMGGMGSSVPTTN
jgi:hypothetical protein